MTFGNNSDSDVIADPEDFDVISLDDVSQDDEEPQSADEDTELEEDEEVLGKGDDMSVLKWIAGAEIFCVVVNPNRGILACGGSNDCVTILDATSMEVISRHSEARETVNRIVWSPDGERLAAACLDGRVLLYGMTDDELMYVSAFEASQKDIEWIDFHVSGRALAAGDIDGMVTVFTWEGKTVSVLVAHEEASTCGSFTSDAKHVVSGGADGALKYFNVKQGVVAWQVRPSNQWGTYEVEVHGGHSNAIICLDVHRSAPLVVTGSEDNTAKIINYDTQKVYQTIRGFADTVEFVSWLPDDNIKICAAASLDGTIQLYNLDTSARHSTVMEHVNDGGKRGGVSIVQWAVKRDSVEGGLRSAFLLSAGLDGTVRIWNPNTCRQIAILTGHTAAVITLAHRIHGGQLEIFSSGDDQVVRKFVV